MAETCPEWSGALTIKEAMLYNSIDRDRIA